MDNAALLSSIKPLLSPRKKLERRLLLISCLKDVLLECFSTLANETLQEHS